MPARRPDANRDNIGDPGRDRHHETKQGPDRHRRRRQTGLGHEHHENAREPERDTPAAQDIETLVAHEQGDQIGASRDQRELHAEHAGRHLGRAVGERAHGHRGAEQPGHQISAQIDRRERWPAAPERAQPEQDQRRAQQRPEGVGGKRHTARRRDPVERIGQAPDQRERNEQHWREPAPAGSSGIHLSHRSPAALPVARLVRLIGL